MPHIYINELDNTVAGKISASTNVVYIPGAIEAGGTLANNDPTMFSTVTEFMKAVTGDVKGKLSADNYNAIMARELLSLGLGVLFESFGTHSALLDAEAIFELVDFSKLTDKGLFKFKFLMGGATESMSRAKDMLECAAKRGDCIALIDHDSVIEGASGDDSVSETIYESFKQIASDDNAKFGAAFSPWCKFDLKEGEMELPGSFAFLSAYGRAVKNNPNWYAAAGFFRGRIPSLVAPVYKFGDADSAVLQGRDIAEDGGFGDNDNQSYAINPISLVDEAGFIVWGNRTLLDNSEAGGLTASSFLNIRNLVCDLKKALYKAARKYTFEQNTDILWINFCSEFYPLLDKAKSGGGIRKYKAERIDTDIKGRLKALIKITPIEAVEDFDLTVEMTDSLEELTESV